MTVRTRLLAAVVVPLLVVGVLVFQVVTGEQDAVRATGDLRDRTSALIDLASLRTQMFEERRQYETVARSAEVGVDPATVSELLGMEVETDPSRARSRTAVALGRVGGSDRPFTMAALAALRREIDAGLVSSSEASKRFDRMETLTVAKLNRALDEVGDRAVSIGDVEVERTVRAMKDAVKVAGLRGRQLRTVTDLWFAADNGRIPALVELSQASGLYELTAADLGATSVTAVAKAWGPLQRAGGTFDDAIAGELAGSRRAVGTSLADLRDIGGILGEGLTHYLALAELPEIASRAVVASSARLGAHAQADARRAASGALAAIGFALVTALWFGRSITRPLRRLTEQARRVSDGELTVAPLSLTGPPELAVASAAFNDVTANLVLMEEKALALSSCDFNSAALARTLPGRLGEALHDSLQVLSGSILERQHLQLRLQHQATHDSLTGLANRSALIDALSGAVARSRRSGMVMAVAFIDLDDFKSTNDTSGHAVGDALLQGIARRMQAAARRGDLVARLGGDEFVIVAENIANVNSAVALVQRVLTAIAAPIEIDGKEFTITASAGVAMDDDREDDPLSLLAKADLAVYRAKNRATSSIELYDEKLQGRVRAQADLESALLATLSTGGEELHIHYQPVLDCESGAVTSLEALVRWNHPTQGLIPPDKFIPIAEGSDLILHLDRWVLHTATRQLMQWSGHPLLRDVTLAINVSARHLMHATFVGNVSHAIQDSGMDPTRLVLELTETALMVDLARAAAQVERIRALGVRVAIDDFGTGHVGLSHIRALTIDEIKIDRSFTAELPGVTHFVQIVIDLARHLGASVVAEGVETEEQARALRELGCSGLQGFLFSPALPPDALVEWLRSHRDRALSWPQMAARLVRP